MKVVAEFDLGKRRYTGDMVKINRHTVLVRVPKRIKNEEGELEIVPHEFVTIKRHYVKHGVVVRSE
jgi:hypothetical protein